VPSDHRGVRRVPLRRLLRAHAPSRPRTRRPPAGHPATASGYVGMVRRSARLLARGGGAGRCAGICRVARGGVGPAGEREGRPGPLLAEAKRWHAAAHTTAPPRGCRGVYPATEPSRRLALALSRLDSGTRARMAYLADTPRANARLDPKPGGRCALSRRWPSHRAYRRSARRAPGAPRTRQPASTPGWARRVRSGANRLPGRACRGQSRPSAHFRHTSVILAPHSRRMLQVSPADNRRRDPGATLASAPEPGLAVGATGPAARTGR
jgi:hypothetical protein